jgi:hypothetical protein
MWHFAESRQAAARKRFRGNDFIYNIVTRDMFDVRAAQLAEQNGDRATKPRREIILDQHTP